METQANYEVKAAQILDLADVKKYIAPGATDKELFMFMNISKAFGLNPFKREVHFIKYGNNPGQVVVGYETFLKRAEASGQLDGWSTTILDQGTEFERAQITIYRKDRTRPFVWEVSRKEFDKGQSTWKLMPQFMLKKVAISQGMRLCFAEQLGGMPYSLEEINGKGSEELPKDEPQAPPITPPPEAKPKSLFEQLMSARGNFASLVKDNKGAVLDLLPDQLGAVKIRWHNASLKGIGGVEKDAPWPLDKDEPTIYKPLSDFEEQTNADPREAIRDEIRKYGEALHQSAWTGIQNYYRSWETDKADVESLNAMLKQCQSTLDKQNEK